MRGKSSSPEVTGIDADGFRIRFEGRELYIDFENFPWFREAEATDIRRLEAPHPGHLRWPRLDVDLTVESIEHPERYPLKAK
jgi:hypothetical protein